jgi:hypothetical protein
MAIETVSRLVDDVNGTTTAVTCVEFSLKGKEYEIDLDQRNANQLLAEISFWAKYARKKGTPRKSAHSTTVPPGTSGDEGDRDWHETPPDANTRTKQVYTAKRKEMREWGKDNGFDDLGELGRLPRALVEKYVREVCGGQPPNLDGDAAKAAK